MGLLHAAILNLLCRGCVKYVIDKSRIVRLGGRLLVKDVEFLGSLEKLVDAQEEVDAVYVTTPTETHFLIAKRLLEAGFENIFIEKPPAQNYDQFNELCDLKGEANIMVGFQKRFALPLRHAKVLLDEGVIGKPENVYVSIKSGDITESNKRLKHLSRGVLLDLGIHAIDLICWLLGGELEVESARYKSIYTGADDYFEAILTAGDIRVRFETTWSDPSYRLPETRIEIKGTKGELRASEDYLKVRTYEPRGEDPIGDELSLYRPHYYRGFPPVLVADQEYTIEDMHFLTVVERKTKPFTSLETCRCTMVTLEELYRRSSYGQRAAVRR